MGKYSSQGKKDECCIKLASAVATKLFGNDKGVITIAKRPCLSSASFSLKVRASSPLASPKGSK